MTSINPSNLKTIPNAQILDVRTHVEHREEALSCFHHHVPLDQLIPAEFMGRPDVDTSKPLYILCKAGGRAQRAQQAFMEAGFTNCFVIKDGIEGCKACQMSTLATGTSITLERQVRIAVGGVILAGTLLGAFITPAFYWLSGLAGAGLVFSGLTGWCGMALLLAKAPWNKA